MANLRTVLGLGLLVGIWGARLQAAEPPASEPPATERPLDRDAEGRPDGAGAVPQRSDPESLPRPPLRRTAPQTDITDGRWYGGQTLAADGVGLGFALVCLNELQAGWGCLLPLVLGTPTVHVVHQNGGRAFASFLMHLALPGLGFVAGLTVSRCDLLGDSCPGAVVGAAVGVAAVTLIDVAVAYDNRGPSAGQDPSAAPVPAALGLSVTPALAIGRGDAFVGLGGRF